MNEKAKRRLFAVLLAGATGALLVAAAEGILRLQERAQLRAMEAREGDGGVIKSDVPGLNYTLNPGFHTGEIRFNSLGFNMPERPVAKPHGMTRIFIVGDSVTQGVGTERTEEAYPNRVQAILSEMAARPLDVWNCGVGGYNAEQVLLLMQHELPRYEPDIILYGFNFNDYWDANRYFFGQPGLLPDQQSPAEGAGWMDRLKTLRVALRLRDAYNNLCYRIRGFSPAYVDYKIGYPSWRRMKDTLREMRDDCARRRVAFAIVVLPNEQFLRVDETRNVAHRDLCAFLDAEGIPYLDLLPPLRADGARGFYLVDGNHMTAAGYDTVARLVVDWLTRGSGRALLGGAP